MLDKKHRPQSEQLIREARRLQESGEPDLAVDSYREALAQRPDHVAGRIALGKLLIAQGQPAAAREELFLALQHDPDQMVARRLMVDANLMLENHLEAHRWLSEYLRVFPQDAEAQGLFATVQGQLGAQASSETAAGTKTPPKAPPEAPTKIPTKTLARLYLEQGHPERASEVFSELLGESPDDPDLDALVDLATERCEGRAIDSKRQLLSRLRQWQFALSRMRAVGSG